MSSLGCSSPDAPRSGWQRVDGRNVSYALPVRVRVKEEEVFPTWLENLQVELAEFREYEHTALRSIQEWVQIPKGIPLYECIVVNTNTLGTRSGGGAAQPQGMARRAMASSVQQNVPLDLDMETVGADLLFKMTTMRAASKGRR